MFNNLAQIIMAIVISGSALSPAFACTAAGGVLHKPDSAAVRLVTSPTDNFIASTEYADSWQRRRMPLKVFLHSCSDVSGFETAYIDSFKSACQRWAAATENQIRFDFTDKADTADIEVRWTADISSWPGKPDENALGICDVSLDPEDGMTHASIFILTRRDSKHVGRKLMEWVSLHELGHSLGLGHSSRAADVMAPKINAVSFPVDGRLTLDAASGSEVKLSTRDVTTLKIVYAAKQKLDAVRQKGLANQNLCVELINESARLISSGDSGQAIIFLNEALRVDKSSRVAQQNLMVAYYNCSVELYNKQRYSEALPLIDKALDLGKRVGNVAELNGMVMVHRNCLKGIEHI